MPSEDGGPFLHSSLHLPFILLFICLPRARLSLRFIPRVVRASFFHSEVEIIGFPFFCTSPHPPPLSPLRSTSCERGDIHLLHGFSYKSAKVFYFSCQIWRFISTIGTCGPSPPFLSYSCLFVPSGTRPRVIIKNRSCHTDIYPFLTSDPVAFTDASNDVNFSPTSRRLLLSPSSA